MTQQHIATVRGPRGKGMRGKAARAWKQSVSTRRPAAITIPRTYSPKGTAA
jgi:hypothetical protein